MCKYAYSSLNAAEHRGNKPETHRLARRTRNPPRPRKAKASSGIDRPRKGKTISQMPFARGASKKSTGESMNTSPRAREESMPTLFEFAAMWGILLLTMFFPIRLKRRPIQPQDA